MKDFFVKNKKIIIIILITVIILIGTLIGYVKTTGKDISSKGFRAILLPSVIYTDNVSGIYVNKDSKFKVTVTLKYFGMNKYYYKRFAYSGKNVSQLNNCTLVKSGNYTQYSLNMKSDDIRVDTIIYKDSNCTKKVINYNSLTYKPKSNSSNSSSAVKTFTVTFKKNGATSIGSERLSCSTSSSSCTVTAPSIIRNGYMIVGWGSSIISNTAKYKVGEKIVLTRNTTLYAITKKTTQSSSKNRITMTKYNENWTVGHSGALTVTTTPKNLDYTITSSNESVMILEKTKTSWRLTSVGPGVATITAKTSTGESVSYTYKVSGTYLSGTARLKKGGKLFKVVDGVNVYAENACATSTINKYVADLNEQPNFIKKVIKNIYLLSESTYKNVNPQAGSVAIASAHITQYSADINCDKYYIGALPHELGHIIDYKYKVYNEGDYMSNSSLWAGLYNEYYNKVMRIDYSTFDNKQEFFADAYTFYFQKVLAKTNPIQNGYYNNYVYPDKIKNNMALTLEQLKSLNMK